ncbi:golgin subfamily A member 6-like protein 2 [Amia ocellicauda]|uniref:golgin subfamily A member 6-like protein 2 n=1 Tax=Amia ocellicauda TaxID=2972642 RepID=UPI003464B023
MTSNIKQENVNLSKWEVLKLLEKCRKERDDTLQREGALRERVRIYETRIRSQNEGLRQKIKRLSFDNKELRKTVKRLRTDLGLESDPQFQGKTTKDIIHELREKVQQCSAILEENRKLSQAVDKLTSELANTATSKMILEERVSSLQRDLKDMTTNQRRLVKLWEDKRAEREHFSLPAISHRTVPRQVCNKSVQTGMILQVHQKCPSKSLEVTQDRRERETSADLKPPPIERRLYSPSNTEKYKGFHNSKQHI